MRPVLVLCIKAPLGLEEVCLASIGIDTLLDGGWLILFKYWETVQAARTHTYIHHVTWLTTHDNPKKRCYALAWAIVIIAGQTTARQPPNIECSPTYGTEDHKKSHGSSYATCLKRRSQK